jgi:hypothetical protein
MKMIDRGLSFGFQRSMVYNEPPSVLNSQLEGIREFIEHMKIVYLIEFECFELA